MAIIQIIKSALVRRIVYVLVGMAIAFITHKAEAATYTPNVVYQVIIQNPLYPNTLDTNSATAACAAYMKRLRTITPSYTYQLIECNNQPAVTSLYAKVRSTSPTGTVTEAAPTGTIIGTKIQTCTAGYSPSGSAPSKVCTGSCTLPAVFDTVAQICQVPIDCTDGKLLDSGTYATTSSPVNNGCIGGCSALFVGTKPQISCAFSGGVGSCDLIKTGRYIATGSQCGGVDSGELTDKTPVNPSTPENQCVKNGQSFGEVSGNIVCVPKGTTGAPTIPPLPDAPKVTTKTNPDGSTTTTTTNTVVNNNGTVTTTTTINNGDGTTDTSSQTQDQAGFCEQNTSSTLCGEGGGDSAFAGSCASSFTCDGDAIQCAIAKEQHERNCILYHDTTTLSDLGNEVSTNGDMGEASNPAADDNREIIDLPESLDASNGGITGTLEDVTVSTVYGQSIVLPFTDLIPYLQFMGYIALAFAYFGAYKIVGGVK